ncbi:MAG: di-heme oxidoredictase family protein [Phycisphaerae bacterium]
MKRFLSLVLVCLLINLLVVGCSSQPAGSGGSGGGGQDQPDGPGGDSGDGQGSDADQGPFEGDGPVAEGISAKLGEIMPSATSDQRATFTRGLDVMQRRFDLADGLGPAFNVTFCGACHEKPTPGGTSGIYRNFFLAGRLTLDGAFLFSQSAGDGGGVLRLFYYGPLEQARPDVPDSTTIFAQRSAIPLFGVGLLAELSDEELLSRADPEDVDGDGISGRANFDRGFVGRFGRKSQTVSIEGFIRGPLFNHLGVTTSPLTDEQRSQLPVDSSTAAALKAIASTPGGDQQKLGPHMQAAAPDGPTVDDDAAPDPEMSGQDLFDLVSFTMLLAAPEFEEPTAQTERGRSLFHEARCADCHVPRLQGPRGPIGAYSDLLLHDMGEDLADGIVMNEASGSEFRTQPLWGLAGTGPYLHDGRVDTIEEAILAHGGEASDSRDAFASYDQEQRDDVVEFLLSLGGRDQFSTGLLEPGAPIPGVGEYGGPSRDLTEAEQERFLRGRELFDHEFGFASGAGSPRLNGDSCRACHFDPVIGGAGPRGVNVMRHGILSAEGAFVPPSVGTILHKETAVLDQAVLPQAEANVYEHRQTPHVFGLGLIESIADETITGNADPGDDDGDGISGRVSITDDGRIGRLGWKAQVPSVAEFVRDAMAAELGLTVELQSGLTFGKVDDNDDVDDPELLATEAEDLAFFIGMLGAPPRQPIADAAQVDAGQALFDTIGCTACHIPSMSSAEGSVPLYSDLLLHEILEADTPGIEDTSANMREFRTAPLWGLSQTRPYLHDGSADTIDDAIRKHAGEASASRDAYDALSSSDKAAVQAFLETL